MMNVSGIGNAERQMQSAEMSQNQLNDSVTKDIQTKIQSEEQKLKDLSYDEMMSAEEKSKKRQEIRKEISDLNRELRQRQMELQQEKQQKAKEMEQEAKAAPKEDALKKSGIDEKEREEEKEKTATEAAHISTVLGAKNNIERVETQTNAVKSVEHQIDVLDGEIHQDKMRGQDVENKKEQKRELENILIGSQKNIIQVEQNQGKAKEQQEEQQRIRVVID